MTDHLKSKCEPQISSPVPNLRKENTIDNNIHYLYRKKPRPCTITTVSTDNSLESMTSQGKITYYNGDLLLPIYSTNQTVLAPLEVVCLLNNVGESVSNELICTRQPLRTEYNRTFIVDLESLKSSEYIKCDNVGHWRNNSCNKYHFQKHDNDWIQQENKDLHRRRYYNAKTCVF